MRRRPLPLQAIFLTPQARSFRYAATEEDLLRETLGGVNEPFVMIEDAGVLVRQELSPAESATLDALVQVLQRIPESASLQYLEKTRVHDLLCADAYRYRKVVEGNGTTRLPFQECGGFGERMKSIRSRGR